MAVEKYTQKIGFDTSFTFEPQPDFPHEDLSQKNAEFFELFLLNKDMVNETNATACANDYAYKIVKTKMQDSDGLFVELNEKAAVVEGMACFGSMLSLLSGHQQDSQIEQLAKGSYALSYVDLVDNLSMMDRLDWLNDVRDEFIQEQPRTAEVVDGAASRYYRSAGEYAIIGAAIGREIETKATREVDEILKRVNQK